MTTCFADAQDDKRKVILRQFHRRRIRGGFLEEKQKRDPLLALRMTIKLRYFFAQDGVENLGFRFDR